MNENRVIAEFVRLAVLAADDARKAADALATSTNAHPAALAELLDGIDSAGVRAADLADRMRHYGECETAKRLERRAAGSCY